MRVDRTNSRVHVGFARDGHTVVIASWDGAIHTLDIRSARWAAFACRIAGRNPTRSEWREAFGDRPYRETCDQQLT